MTPVAQVRIERALLLAAVALVWRNAFEGAFQFDDFAAIVQDPAYAQPAAFFADLPGRIRPATRISLLLDRLAFGLHPAGYHVQSVLLHAACGLLLHDIVRGANLGNRTVAFGAALLFLVHPIACETVTYISGRASGLSAFFVLLALWLYVKATAGAAVERPAPILWIASILCFALALAAKETAAMFPLLLLVWDACARERGHAPPRAWRLRCHAPYWAVLAMAIVVVALAVPRYRELAAVSLALRSPLENLFAQAKPLVLALVLFVRPALLNIDHDLAPASVHDATAWAAPAGLVGLLVVALKARRIPALGLGVLWFFVAALPANGPVARLDLLSERNLYLPMAGLALAAAGSFGAVAVPLMDRLGAAGGALAALVALITIGALAMATVERNAVWADPVALWSDAVAKSPRKSRPHDNLGYALERQGDLAGAIREYRRALDLDPNNARAWSNLRRAWRAAEPD